MPLKNFTDWVSFARASDGWYYDATGTLVKAASGVPRVSYDPLTKALRGLQVEEARTNLLWPSMVVTNSPTYYTITDANGWVPGQTAKRFVQKGVGAPNTPAANGGQFTSTGAMCAWIIFEADPASAPGANTQLLFYKTSGTAAVWGGAGAAHATGVAAPYPGAGTVTAGCDKLANVGPNGGVVYRLWVATTNPTGETLNAYPYPITGATSTDQSVFMHHFQLEAGSFPSSVIPTTTAQVTRAADAPQLNTAAAWFNPNEGTLFAELVVPNFIGAGQLPGIAGFISPDLVTNNFGIALSTVNSKAQLFRGVGGVSQPAISTANVVTPYVTTKVACAYSVSSNDAICLNGGAVVPTPNAGGFSGTDKLRIGRFLSNPGWLNGWITDLRYYPRRLSDAELQSITL